ncbi:MAG: hypothetical protein E7593_03940 [Ruminococcaceae bacterium]|nr:hypothetical protein [Oscillospiraceae bacterium]
MKSPLATKEILTKNYSKRTEPVTTFTPHHWAVEDADPETIAKNFDRNGNSANYVIGNDGTIILCVPEEYRAYTSGSIYNDNKAITVEVANESGAPEWRISDAALESLINLGVDICRRHHLPGFNWTGDKNGTLTIHKMFEATACPGPYLESKMPYIAEEITRRLKECTNMVYNINVDELKKQGYTTISLVLGETSDKDIVNSIIPEPTIKPVEVIVDEVIAGKWGNGAEREQRLTVAGYSYNEIQSLVDQRFR